MSNTAHKHKMLRMIAQEPRSTRSFTEGSIYLNWPTRIVERYLAEMLTEGWIRDLGGLYRITAKGRAEVDKPTTKAEPRTWCHASTKGSYVSPAWNVRDGANQNQQYRSLQFGA